MGHHLKAPLPSMMKNINGMKSGLKTVTLKIGPTKNIGNMWAEMLSLKKNWSWTMGIW